MNMPSKWATTGRVAMNMPSKWAMELVGRTCHNDDSKMVRLRHSRIVDAALAERDERLVAFLFSLPRPLPNYTKALAEFQEREEAITPDTSDG